MFCCIYPIYPIQKSRMHGYNMLVLSAIKLKNGTVLYGVRHGEILQRAYQKYGIPITDLEKATQGFVDEYSNFYNRSEAEAYARKENQLIGDIIGGELTSEDLW